MLPNSYETHSPGGYKKCIHLCTVVKAIKHLFRTCLKQCSQTPHFQTLARASAVASNCLKMTCLQTVIQTLSPSPGWTILCLSGWRSGRLGQKQWGKTNCLQTVIANSHSPNCSPGQTVHSRAFARASAVAFSLGKLFAPSNRPLSSA